MPDADKGPTLKVVPKRHRVAQAMEAKREPCVAPASPRKIQTRALDSESGGRSQGRS